MEYLIKCPTCQSTFDCSEQLDIWFNQFIGKMNEVIKEMKDEDSGV